MNKEIIEKKLRNWFSLMTKKYSWLRVKFEFNQRRGVFMVSFSPVSRIEQSDEFNLDAINFADEMNETYGNEAPLFTDEETLFKLSVYAEVVGVRTYTTGSQLFSKTPISVQSQNILCSWTPATASTSVQTGKNFRQTQSEVSFAFAA